MIELIKKYPFVEDKDPNSDIAAGETWVDCLPTGWRSAFLELCEKIKIILTTNLISLDALSFGQVKEKFGRARVYWDITEEDISESIYETINVLVDAFEHDSGCMCSVCGGIATHRSTGWVLPYCYSCATEQNAAANIRHKTNFDFNTSFVPLLV